MPIGISAQIMGHKPSALAEKHYRRRPLDLLRKWHDLNESWILQQAGIEFTVVGPGLRIACACEGGNPADQGYCASALRAGTTSRRILRREQIERGTFYHRRSVENLKPAVEFLCRKFFTQRGYKFFVAGRFHCNVLVDYLYAGRDYSQVI